MRAGIAWWAWCGLVLGLCAFGSLRASADVVYSFLPDQAVYRVAPGAVFQVPIYFQESVSGPDSSLLASPEQGGLMQAQVAVQRQDVSGLLDAARISNYWLNAVDFDGLPLDFSTLPDRVDATQFVALERTSGPDGQADGGRILLLTLEITAGAFGSETTAFDIADALGFDETLTFSGMVLDPLAGPGGFTVSVVPLPATAIAGGALIAVLGLCRGLRAIRARLTP